MKNPMIEKLYGQIAKIKKNLGDASQENRFLQQIYFDLAQALVDEVNQYQNLMALYCLAELYEHGNGVEQNSSMAFDYYHCAAQNNQVDAIYRLGRAYEMGDPNLGVSQNKQLAQDCFINAANLGHKKTQHYIFNKLVPEMSDEGFEALARDIREKKAMQLLSTMENMKDIDHLGVRYHVIMGLQNPTKTRAFILEAPNTFVEYFSRDSLLSNEEKESCRKQMIDCFGLSSRSRSPWDAENIPLGNKEMLSDYAKLVLQSRAPDEEIINLASVNDFRNML